MPRTEVRGGQILDGTVSLTADVTGMLPNANGGWTAAQQAAFRGLPSYALTDPVGPNNAALGLYNAKSTNMRKTHKGLVSALNGGKMNIAVIGDSVSTGYNGSAVIDRNSFAQRMQLAMCGQLGVARAGGFHAALAAISLSSDRWTLNAGTVNGSSFAGLLQMNAGAAITFQTEQECTGFDIVSTETSVSGWTYQVDGGTPVPVTTTGASTYKKISITGLTLGYHSIRLNTSANFLFVVAVCPTVASGIAMHNLGFGGSRANGGSGAVNWTDTVTANQLYSNHKVGFDILGITPDLVICELGGNDIFQGDTPVNAIAGLTTIRGWWPTADFLMVGLSNLNGTNMTNWDDYWHRKYLLADTLDVPLLDYRSKMGDYTEALANGLLGADNAHLSNGSNIELGRLLATAVMSVVGGLSDFDPDTSGFVDRTRGGAEQVAVADGTTGTVTLRLAGGSIQTLTPTGNVTALNIADVPASGKSCTVTLIVTQGATPRTIATPPGGVFLGTASPTQLANKTCVFTYQTVDGGTTWICQGVVQV